MATYTVSPDANKIIKEYAEQIGVDSEKALDKLLLTADSRRKALAKYAKKQSVEKKAAPARKAGKAKGPLARKQKAAPKKAKSPKSAATIPVVSGDEAAAS